MRFFSTGLRLAAVALLLAATPVLAQSSSPAPDAAPGTVPEELQGMVGDFILEQDDETLPACPVTLTDQAAIGGWAITVPDACPAPYPAADSLVAWNVDPADGSVLFLDAERHVVLRLLEDEDGLYDTDPNVQPRFTLLAPYQDEGSGGEADSD